MVVEVHILLHNGTAVQVRENKKHNGSTPSICVLPRNEGEIRKYTTYTETIKAQKK